MVMQNAELTSEKNGASTNTTLGRRKYLAAVGGTAITTIAGCTGGDDATGDQVVAAWVMDGSPTDQGWVRSHDEARLSIEENNDWLTTLSQEEVSAEESERVIADFAEEADIVFTNSAIYEDETAAVAEDFPDTHFENAFGLETRENMSRYTFKTHEARYAVGVAAGMLTESDRLGFISGFEIPQVFREANAFLLGAQSVNPDATLDVAMTGAFIAQQESTSIVNSWAEDGIDVVTAHANTPATVSAAASNEIWGTGTFFDQSEAGGDWYVSAILPTWENYYQERCEAVRDETWESQEFWAGIADGVVEVGDFGPQVPQDVIDEALEAEEAIATGELDMWEGTQFEGESDEPGGFIETEMDSYVDGVNT